jgi:hypothetical protein
MNGVRKFAIIAVLSGLTALNVIPYKTFAYDIPLKKQKIKENSFQFDHKTAQVNPQSVANYPCDNFSINAEDKISPDVPKTEEEKKQFELANPPNPGLVTYNYLYRSGDVPDAPRLARVYGVKPEDWNEHRTPGFIVNGRKVYLRWFRIRYSVVDYEYKFVTECYQKPEKPKNKNELTLTKATTTDAQSVTVDYTIEISDQEEASQPIHFEIYRSPVEDAAPSSHKIGEEDIKIGENDIPNQTNSTPDKNKHKVKLTLDKDALKPNTAFPYVVVVGTYNGKKSTTYFQKYLLGVIAHGFNRWNRPYIRRVAGAYELFLEYNYPQTVPLIPHPRENLTGIPDWEIIMARNLEERNRYNHVISFNWTETCAIAEKGMAVQAGSDLAKQIVKWMFGARSHDGDVVDIHLIGHSRGTVVVTQALQHLSTASPSFEGGYVELTLLDPHPANNEFGKWYDEGSFTDMMATNPLYGSIVNRIYDIIKDATDFQNAAQDPSLKIPKNVKKIDVWYQNTHADDLSNEPDQEYIMNLWGLIGSNVIQNNSGVLIEPHDKTTKPGVKPAIGHNQIPDIYEEQVVETGNLNRSE